MMICAMCTTDLIEALDSEEIDAVITVIVTELAGGIEAGHFCSTKCLIDYVAKVSALELEEETHGS